MSLMILLASSSVAMDVLRERGDIEVFSKASLLQVLRRCDILVSISCKLVVLSWTLISPKLIVCMLCAILIHTQYWRIRLRIGHEATWRHVAILTLTQGCLDTATPPASYGDFWSNQGCEADHGMCPGRAEDLAQHQLHPT